MQRGCWVKPIGSCLVAMLLFAGVANADLIDAANLRQISDGATLSTGPVVAFLTTDQLFFRADYYDPAAICDGVPPKFVTLFLFTQEGRFVQQFDAASVFNPSATKFRELRLDFLSIASIPLAPGSYKWMFLVRDCTDTKSTVLPEFLSFQVFAP